MRTDAATAFAPPPLSERQQEPAREPRARAGVRAAPAERPLRILVYGLNFSPELTGIGRYTGDMCAWLAEQGHAVTAVTAYPYYPHWKLAAGRPVWRWQREDWRGVSVWRCPLWVPKLPTTATRIVHLLSFMLTSAPVALAVALRQRPDVIFTVEPTSFCAPWALLAAKLTGARSWLHVQDIEFGAAERLGLLGRAGPAGLLLRGYARMLRGFDRVTTLSGRMRAKLAEFGRDEDGIGLFPNWVDTDKFRPVDATALRAELGIAADEVVVLYAGNLGEKQGVEQLLDVAALLEDDPRIRMVICGAGAARARIEARLPAHANVMLLDPQPDERFVELLSMADIHVLPQKKGMTHYVMPSKLGPMMASGRPIVAQAEEGCEIRNVLGQSDQVVRPESAQELGAAVRGVASSCKADMSSNSPSSSLTESLSRRLVLNGMFV